MEVHDGFILGIYNYCDRCETVAKLVIQTCVCALSQAVPCVPALLSATGGLR